VDEGARPAIDAVTNPAAVAARFDTAYQQLREDGSIQFALPPHVVEPTPTWLIELLGFLSGLGPIMQGLFWLGVAVIVALLTWAIYGRVRETLARRDLPADHAPIWRPEAAPARALLEAADALARQGRFADAVHLLLQRSLEEIGRHLPDFLRPSLTSRDIAAATDLPQQPRQAFAEIARAVEISLFGGRPLDADRWQSCRSAYERFAFAEEWRR